jgi:hypothetical protein
MAVLAQIPARDIVDTLSLRYSEDSERVEPSDVENCGLVELFCETRGLSSASSERSFVADGVAQMRLCVAQHF